MASPQKEHGYTPIANEIMDALMKTSMSDRCRRCLDCILRNTYGYQKRQVKIAASTMSEATGIDKGDVSKSMAELVRRKIIKIVGHATNHLGFVVKTDDKRAKVYEFNKNYDEWVDIVGHATNHRKIVGHATNNLVGHATNHRKFAPLDLKKKEIFLSELKSSDDDEMPISGNGGKPPEKKTPPKKQPPKFAPDSPPITLSALLAELMKKNNPKVKVPSNLQPWAKQIDLMIRRDNRDPQDIEKVIRFSQADSFWFSNVLSTQTLRKQFDKLWLKMTRSGPSNVIAYDPIPKQKPLSEVM